MGDCFGQFGQVTHLWHGLPGLVLHLPFNILQVNAVNAMAGILGTICKGLRGWNSSESTPSKRNKPMIRTQIYY